MPGYLSCVKLIWEYNAHPFCAYFTRRRCVLFMGNIIPIVIGALVGLAAGFVFGVIYRKNVAEKEIGSAELQAKKILEDGIKAAETKKKEALIKE